MSTVTRNKPCTFSVSVENLQKLLRVIEAADATASNRYALGGILLLVQPDSITAIASDARWLLRQVVHCDTGCAVGFSVLLDAKSCKRLLRWNCAMLARFTFKGRDVYVDCLHDDKSLETLHIATCEGRFPDVEKQIFDVMQGDRVETVLAPRYLATFAKLAKSSERVEISLRDRESAARLTTPDGLTAVVMCMN